VLALILSTALAAELVLPVELPEVRDAQSTSLAHHLWVPPGDGGLPPAPFSQAPTRTEARLTRAVQGVASDRDLLKLLAKDLLAPAVVMVGPTGISVSGVLVAELDRGRLAPERIQRNRIPALYEALRDATDATKVLHQQLAGTRFEPRLLLAIDARVPSETVNLVLYSAGVAGIERFDVLVSTSDSPTTPRQSPAEDAVHADISLSVDLSTVRLSDETMVRHARPIALEGALLRGGGMPPVGCATIALPNGLPWQRVAETMASVHGAGGSWTSFAIAQSRGPAQSIDAAPASTSLPFDAPVAALPLRLPVFGPPPDGTEPACPE